MFPNKKSNNTKIYKKLYLKELLIRLLRQTIILCQKIFFALKFTKSKSNLSGMDYELLKLLGQTFSFKGMLLYLGIAIV